jgi:hypothetical protein
MMVVTAHESVINNMKKSIKGVQEKMSKEKAKRSGMKERLRDAEERLDELDELEKVMKGFVLGKKFAK